MARVGWCFHAILFFIILKFGGRQTMTLKEKNQIYKLREKGLSYSKIAKQTGFSESTIKSFFRRENLRNNNEEEINKKCRYCGKKLVQTKGHRQKKFCSDKCRFAWWKSAGSDLPEDSPYIFRCKNCGKEFNRCGKKNRKYCSFGCYIIDRFKRK